MNLNSRVKTTATAATPVRVAVGEVPYPSCAEGSGVQPGDVERQRGKLVAGGAFIVQKLDEWLSTCMLYLYTVLKTFQRTKSKLFALPCAATYSAGN